MIPNIHTHTHTQVISQVEALRGGDPVESGRLLASMLPDERQPILRAMPPDLLTRMLRFLPTDQAAAQVCVCVCEEGSLVHA